MRVAIIGLGLIGGSVGLKIKSENLATEVIGVDSNTQNCEKAVALALVDRTLNLDEALSISDLIIVAIPVTTIVTLLPSLLDNINADATIVDLGSTKHGICESIANHKNRQQYVAAHPIAGTENSGPEAAFASLFEGRKGIICDKENSNTWSYDRVKALFTNLGMETIDMDSKSHDLHIAYVSHISHISSFVLGQTVLELEKDEENIFNMAGSGFESTVRLAKSSPQMWAPIFRQNKKPISDALGAYINNLAEFKKLIDDEDENSMIERMKNANDIRRVLNGI